MTTLLLNDLDKFTDERRILPEKFQCKSYDSCNQSTGDKMIGGAGCMLSHVGLRIEETGQSVPRLAIVGMDHGENDCGSYTERTLGITDIYISRGEPFNDHYQGVVRTAAAFSGSFGAECDQGCWRQRRCRKSVDAQTQTCVLERIAQPNIVKCAPGTENRTSRATATMRTNCSRHLLAEFAMYRPQIAVFHGVKSKWHFLAILREAEYTYEKLPVETEASDIAFVVPQVGLKLFFFRHPTYGWLADQWESDVVPCLRYLSESGDIQ